MTHSYRYTPRAIMAGKGGKFDSTQGVNVYPRSLLTPSLPWEWIVLPPSCYVTIAFPFDVLYSMFEIISINVNDNFLST